MLCVRAHARAAEYMRRNATELRLNGLIYDITVKKRISGNRFTLSAVKRIANDFADVRVPLHGAWTDMCMSDLLTPSNMCMHRRMT